MEPHQPTRHPQPAPRRATQRVVFVHAHPDDESLWSGGTIAAMVAAGIEVTLVTATRGERGEVIPPDLAHLEGTDALAPVREDELRAAVAALGLGDQRYLGAPGARILSLPARRYLDSGMRWGADGKPVPLEPLDPASLCAASLGEAAEDIAFVLRDVEADAVFTYDAFGGYGHPDHIRVHDATVRAAAAAGVPAYAIVSDPSGAAPDELHELSEGAFARKRAAIAAHRTQAVVEGDTFRLSSGPFRPIGTRERFEPISGADGAASVAATARASSAAPKPTLSSRVVTGAFALVGGAIVGAVTTIAHRSTLAVAGVNVPVGLVIGVLAVTAVVLGLRLVLHDRFVALLTGIGILGVIALFSLPSTGGSVLITQGWLGTAWTIAPVLAATIVIAWPRLPQRAPR